MKIKPQLLLALVFSNNCAHATLVKTDFLNPNDGLIVSDSLTGFEWLTPLYTKGYEHGSPFIEGIIANHGFRYGTAEETFAFLNNIFPLAFVARFAPGDANGYVAARSAFNLLGITATGTNGAGFYNEILGITGTQYPGAPNGFYYAYGFAQYPGTNGRGHFIDNLSSGLNGTATLGSYLVRSTADSAVPEPSTAALLGLSLVLIGSYRTRKSTRKF